MQTKTYAGIPEEFAKLEQAKVVLIPVPYDGTSTWQKGADKGPEAFLHASENMELYNTSSPIPCSACTIKVPLNFLPSQIFSFGIPNFS